jgi:chorismate mutase
MKDILPIFDSIDTDGKPLVIAGPCSAETEEQVITTARGLGSASIKIFRAGIWKPRTHPGGFEGVGAEGLEWLKRVKAETGMKVTTEVATRAHVYAALDAGVDILWIGARTSANPFAMQEIADALAERAVDVPVLVKNPVNPDLELWIGAMQRIYNAGIHRIGAIHRGFSAYGKHMYRNMPQWHIPIELRRRYPNLPIICDPSHMGGKRELVAPISQQALDMGFDGLIIESHCNPDCAWSDKDQQVTPEVLNLIVNTLVQPDKTQSTESLSLLRQEIDRIDNELLEVLNRRMRISREIGQYKKEHSMPVLQTKRYDTIMNSRVHAAEEMGMSPDFMRVVLSAIHEESVRQQVNIFDRK